MTFAISASAVKYPRNSTMAIDVQVQCINKPDRTNEHERIQNIGGVNGDGTRWKLSEDAAILGMKAGKWTFYTFVNNVRANVKIARHRLGHEFLTTHPDGTRVNNLLYLPECPY
jgi:hypothetical protein